MGQSCATILILISILIANSDLPTSRLAQSKLLQFTYLGGQDRLGQSCATILILISILITNSDLPTPRLAQSKPLQLLALLTYLLRKDRLGQSCATISILITNEHLSTKVRFGGHLTPPSAATRANTAPIPFAQSSRGGRLCRAGLVEAGE